jgi:hypothetical protein
MGCKYRHGVVLWHFPNGLQVSPWYSYYQAFPDGLVASDHHGVVYYEAFPMGLTSIFARRFCLSMMAVANRQVCWFFFYLQVLSAVQQMYNQWLCCNTLERILVPRQTHPRLLACHPTEDVNEHIEWYLLCCSSFCLRLQNKNFLHVLLKRFTWARTKPQGILTCKEGNQRDIIECGITFDRSIFLILRCPFKTLA